MTYLKRASVYKNKTTQKKQTKKQKNQKNKSCINIPPNNTAVECSACFIYNICHGFFPRKIKKQKHFIIPAQAIRC